MEIAALAQWMIGESYFHQQQYASAVQCYQRVASTYDYPTWRAAALLQAGKCYELTKSWPDAVRAYSQVVRTDDSGQYAELASRRLRIAQQMVATRR